MKDTLTCITVSQDCNQIITASNLYTRLDLGTQDNFVKVLTYFIDNNKQYILKNVKHLSLRGVRIDSNLVATLPILFPNVTHLVWIDEVVDYGLSYSYANSPSRYEFKQNLMIHWKRLEYIEDSFVGLNISTRLLESCTSNSLKT